MVKPIQIVENYNSLEEVLLNKALKFLYVTLLETGWGKELTDVYVENSLIIVIIRDNHSREDSKKYYEIRFNEDLEICI